MCRSIKVLRVPGNTATEEDLRGAAVQFVRKISGFHKPSKANQQAFEQAVAEIQDASDRLLKALSTAAPRDRTRQVQQGGSAGLIGNFS